MRYRYISICMGITIFTQIHVGTVTYALGSKCTANHFQTVYVVNYKEGTQLSVVNLLNFGTRKSSSPHINRAAASTLKQYYTEQQVLKLYPNYSENLI